MQRARRRCYVALTSNWSDLKVAEHEASLLELRIPTRCQSFAVREVHTAASIKPYTLCILLLATGSKLCANFHDQGALNPADLFGDACQSLNPLISCSICWDLAATKKATLGLRCLPEDTNHTRTLITPKLPPASS